MTKKELMETYTAEQLADKYLRLQEEFNRYVEVIKGIVSELLEELKNGTEFHLEISRLQSEVEKYRKAFEGAKKEYDCQIAEHRKMIEELYNSLRTLEGNLKVSNVIIEETIKNENGEKSNTVKFGSIKQFAEYIKCFYTVNLDYIRKILQGHEQNINHNISDFLPTEPIKVADMLINAEGEYEHNPLAKALCGEDKGTYRIFDVSELRQIAEHLLIYCNHNKEEKE